MDNVIMVVAVKRLSRWKVKILLTGLSPTSPIRVEITTPLFPNIYMIVYVLLAMM